MPLISIQTANTLSSIKAKELDAKALLTQQVDSIALLGHISHELACLRRYKIKSVLKPEFASICTDDGQLSKLSVRSSKRVVAKLIMLRTNHTTRAHIRNEITTMDGRNTAGQTTNQHPGWIFTVEGSRTLGRKAGDQLN